MDDLLEYSHFVTQVLSRHKSTLSRDELLRLGDDAASRVGTQPGGPILTESSLLREVDRCLIRQLALPSLSEWIRQRGESGQN